MEIQPRTRAIDIDELRTPFKDAVRITEATQLAVKASRFPGQLLL